MEAETIFQPLSCHAIRGTHFELRRWDELKEHDCKNLANAKTVRQVLIHRTPIPQTRPMPALPLFLPKPDAITMPPERSTPDFRRRRCCPRL